MSLPRLSNPRPVVPVALDECRFAGQPCDARVARAIAHDLRDGVPGLTRAISATVPPDASGEVLPSFTTRLAAAMFDEIVDARTGRKANGGMK